MEKLGNFIGFQYLLTEIAEKNFSKFFLGRVLILAISSPTKIQLKWAKIAKKTRPEKYPKTPKNSIFHIRNT